MKEHPMRSACAANRGFTLKLAAVFIAGLGVGAPASAAESGAARAFDFIVENVCLDAKGAVLVGVSPIDGDPRCVTQRDLRPGEALAYHEREWPRRDGDSARMLHGSDSFPVKTRQFGTVAIHIYDPGDDPGGAFGRYDPAQQDGGGTIAAISDDVVGFVATQLGRQDLHLFIGKQCLPGQPVTAASLLDSWVLAPLDKLSALDIAGRDPNNTAGPVAEGTVSLPGGMVIAHNGATCPDRRGNGTTRWSVRPVTYRAVYKAGPKRGLHVKLWTLVAERFGRSADELDQVLSFERAYFTRELGWTRWEAWKSAKASFSGTRNWASDAAGGPNQRVSQAHDRVVERDNCGLPDSVSPESRFAIPAVPTDSHGAPRGDLMIVGCIDVTNIVPPRDTTKGDPPPVDPGSWYGATIAGGSPGAALFGP
jgi:hypothetical protein